MPQNWAYLIKTINSQKNLNDCHLIQYSIFTLSLTLSFFKLIGLKIRSVFIMYHIYKLGLYKYK